MVGRGLASVVQERAWPNLPGWWLPLVCDGHNPPFVLHDKSLTPCVGGSSCSRSATTCSTSAPSTSSTALKPTVSPTTGAAACSSPSCCGTRTTPIFSTNTQPTTVSPRRRATGDSQGSWRLGRCSTRRGKVRTGRSSRTTAPTSAHTSGSSRTRQVCCGTTSTTMIRRRRRATSVSRIRAPPAT